MEYCRLGRLHGSLFVPHIDEPNQKLGDPAGMNEYGRWDFGPW